MLKKILLLNLFLSFGTAHALPCKILGCGGDDKGGGCQYLGYVDPQMSKSYVISIKDGYKVIIQYKTEDLLRVSLEDLTSKEIQTASGNPIAKDVESFGIELWRKYPENVSRGWAVKCSKGIPNEPSDDPDLTKQKSKFMTLTESSIE